MRTPALINEKIIFFQNDCYQKLNDFSRNHPILGRCFCIPLALLDIATDVLIKKSLFILQNLAFALLNLVGAAFHSRFTLAHAFYEIKAMVRNITYLPFDLLKAPFKALSQCFRILLRPENAKRNGYSSIGYTDIKWERSQFDNAAEKLEEIALRYK